MAAGRAPWPTTIREFIRASSGHLSLAFQYPNAPTPAGLGGLVGFTPVAEENALVAVELTEVDEALTCNDDEE